MLFHLERETTFCCKLEWPNSHQRFDGLKIFNLVIADAQVGQLGTFLEGVQAGADSVVAQFKLLQLRQLWEPLQTEKTKTKKRLKLKGI